MPGLGTGRGVRGATEPAVKHTAGVAAEAAIGVRAAVLAAAVR